MARSAGGSRCLLLTAGYLVSGGTVAEISRCRGSKPAVGRCSLLPAARLLHSECVKLCSWRVENHKKWARLWPLRSEEVLADDLVEGSLLVVAQQTRMGWPVQSHRRHTTETLPVFPDWRAKRAGRWQPTRLNCGETSQRNNANKDGYE